MLMRNLRPLIFLLILTNCVLPIISQTHHRKHYKNKDRKIRYAGLMESSKGTSAHQTKSVGTSTDPELKSVNTLPDRPVKKSAESSNNVGSGHDSNVGKINKNSVHADPKLNPNGQFSTPSNVHDQHKLLDTEVFKSLLKDLLTRLDSYGANKETFITSQVSNSLNPSSTGEGPRHKSSRNARHCTLHGLWLSTVAGAAIELVPEQQQGHIEIHTRIFELPDNPFPPLINSQWTGKGIISQESPTTLTIVFQEHIDTEKENHAKERGLGKAENTIDDSPVTIQLPRTAVFVGQCLVCQGNPTLQGAWVVFPASQTCTAAAGFMGSGMHNMEEEKRDSIRMTTQDAIYLLSYY